jgi:hypothetical protein
MDYPYVGTLTRGRHYVASLNQMFEAGDEVPLTEADVAAFGDKFFDIQKAEKPEAAKSTRKTGKK